MTLEYTDNGTVVLTECPVCGHEWPRDGEQGVVRWRHIETHAPEDFGLTPLGTTPNRDPAPLFDTPDMEVDS